MRRRRGSLTLLRALPGVARRASRSTAPSSTRLLRPWLGGDGADPELPIPAMIDVDLADAGDAAVDARRGGGRAGQPERRGSTGTRAGCRRSRDFMRR